MSKELLFRIGVVILIGGITLFLYWWGARLAIPPGHGPVKPTSDSRVSQPTPVEQTVREITVTGSEYKFSPGNISVARGEQVRIIFQNSGTLPHNLTINKLGIDTDTIPGGGSTTIEFVAGKTGIFTMFCSVGNHRSLGMEGEVEVK